MHIPFLTPDTLTSIVNTVVVIIVIAIYRRLKRTRVNMKTRTALITGGASGIGLATAKKFATIGMNIVIWDKNEALMEESRKEILECMKDGYYLIQQVVDISCYSFIKSAYLDLHKQLSENNIDAVSIIVNNAGIVYNHSIIDMNPADLDNIFYVNAIAPINVIHTFMPDLINQRISNIVNISSLIAFMPASHLISSKAAIIAMSNSLRVELKSTNNDHIRVSTICPQFVNTGMFDGALDQQFLGHRILKSLFPPNSVEDIAKEVVYAISYEKDEIVIPRLVGWLLPILSILPHVVTDYVYMFAGGSNGMNTFKGRDHDWNESIRRDKEENLLYTDSEKESVVSCTCK